MFCPNCKKIIPENALFCEFCGTATSPAADGASPAAVYEQPKKKGMPTAVKIILILMAIGIAIGIISAIFYDPVKEVKNGYFKISSEFTVGEMFDTTLDNVTWSQKSIDGNTIVCCEGEWLGRKVMIPLFKEDGNVYFANGTVKVNGKIVSDSEASEMITSIYLYYRATTE